MRLRCIDPRDAAARDQMIELHAKMVLSHRIPYLFPDPADPVNVKTIVAEDASGRIAAAVVGRKAMEGFLLLDPEWEDPASRLRAIRDLYSAGAKLAYNLGFRELHAAVPAGQRGYIKRLRRMKFVEDPRRRLIMDLAAIFGGERP